MKRFLFSVFIVALICGAAFAELKTPARQISNDTNAYTHPMGPTAQTALDYLFGRVITNAADIASISNRFSELMIEAYPYLDTNTLDDVQAALPMVYTNVSFTATSWKLYAINTCAAGITVTLPGAPASGERLILLDAGGCGSTNTITIGRNGKRIMAIEDDMVLDQNYYFVGLVFVNDSLGWRIYQ